MEEPRRVAVLTALPELRAAALRLATLVGAAGEVVAGGDAARAVWRSADAVLVGADRAATLAAGRPGRRPGVAVISDTPADDSLWRAAVALGATGVYVLPGDEHGLAELLSDPQEAATAVGSVVAVMAGSGGAGASTFAAALALASARTSPAVLVDGDRLGGGLDVLLGLECAPGLRWPELAAARGTVRGDSVADRLLTVAGCSVLPWHRGTPAAVSAEAAGAVLDALARAFSVIVVDLPRSPDPVATVLAAAAERTVVCCLASVRSVAATASLIADLAARRPRIELVVRDPGGSRLSVADITRALGVPVTAVVRSEPAVAAAAERGELPPLRARSSLARAATAVLAAAEVAA